jgi:uncharacterized membrane protein YesL
MKNRIRSRSAMAKLKAILVIDILIVAVAAGVYWYLQAEGLIVAGPKPAEFAVTDITINPLERKCLNPSP